MNIVALSRFENHSFDLDRFHPFHWIVLQSLIANELKISVWDSLSILHNLPISLANTNSHPY
jgi:hypothetical protein